MSKSFPGRFQVISPFPAGFQVIFQAFPSPFSKVRSDFLQFQRESGTLQGWLRAKAQLAVGPRGFRGSRFRHGFRLDGRGASGGGENKG